MENIETEINKLIQLAGGDPESFEGNLISQQINNSLKIMKENHDTGQIKLITNALKEMRYAYSIFNQYPAKRRISIFGSARTPEEHPDYIAAKSFSHKLAEHGWMCITGAANGIMKAGLEGQTPETSFGLSIRLPFEIPTNSIIEGDPKLINFRYFFTRKLMFMSHSHALAAFPGGFGTLDEVFEMLTLIQTGKANIVPIVLLEGEGGVYWKYWNNYVEKNLFANNLISPEDVRLYYIAPTVSDAIEHIEQFYNRYHSSRYVKNNFVIRLKKTLSEKELETLNKTYSRLLASGKFTLRNSLPEEDDHLDLPRLVFHHTRQDFGLIRKMIDHINDL